MTAAASTYNGQDTAPIDTQVITAVLRLGCSTATDGACLPTKAVEGVVVASFDNGASSLSDPTGWSLDPYIHQLLPIVCDMQTAPA